MNLYNTRLEFAHRLIRHWLDIRGGALVPLEADIDPNELAPIFGSLGIIVLRRPFHLVFELAGERMCGRFGRDVHQVDVLHLIPSAVHEAGKIAIERVRDGPCAYYHRYTVSRSDAAAVTTEMLSLPLRRRFAALPDAVISVTQEHSVDATNAPVGWLTPSASVDDFFDDFVDIEYPFVGFGWRCPAALPLLRKNTAKDRSPGTMNRRHAS